ncbi:MAG: hypothetical protein QS748_03475 [Candidatus Endonucleobacter bathymodioli]|uniref:Transposase n=1 Tax=Candidatus Endonucleibacter bathymodioli TaxID=539814 RepID=A0AA90NJZ0_9GAMM|nr:hypothetical protein [Candidatus Endonucleobacter bathymodioli]
MNFHYLLERNGLARKIFKSVNDWLSDTDVLVKEGMLMDATIIEAPNSNKNKASGRNPERHKPRRVIRALRNE